ncbi:MAG: ATP-binding cassette domain-containing protein [Candidatus Omnitrophica bacterium]|nr:ATP-binding cassette domain-containing protein [Candidatus Omnitrophota bacterium]
MHGIQNALLEVENLRKEFPIERGLLRKEKGKVQALSGVSFEIQEGEIIGLVGESGCGKTTLAKLILRLLFPNGGEIRYQGKDLLTLEGKELKAFRREIQMVFQDPFGSLNPRMKIKEIVGEPLLIHGIGSSKERHRKVIDLLESVGLQELHAGRYPHEFSGGERQRIGIARSLALSPRLLVLDEPVSSLDLSIQAQILRLLLSLKKERNLTYLFISHDLRVVSKMSDRVLVMYLGKIVESGTTTEIFEKPEHPYTRALLASQPQTIKEKGFKGIPKGEIPSPANPPSGCRYRTRCPHAEKKCAEEEPLLLERTPGHFVACHFEL